MLSMGYKRTSPHYVLFASLIVKSPQKLLGLLSSMLAIAPLNEGHLIWDSGRGE
jgi:hypothetical protein